MDLTISAIKAQIEEILRTYVDTSTETLKEFAPDLSELAQNTASYSLKAAMGDPTAKDVLENLLFRAQLIGARIADKEQKISQQTFQAIIDVSGKLAAAFVKSMIGV